MIRCTRCHRILAKPAAEVRTTAGTAYYGPACAVRAGLIAAPVRASAAARRRAARITLQGSLLEGVAP